jgi:2,5-diketo-D-gluconate reductase A
MLVTQLEERAVLSLAFAAGALGAVKTIEIAPGVDMPMVGIGTWQYNDTVAGAAVTSALDLGYTLIDTAWIYGNQGA